MRIKVFAAALVAMLLSACNPMEQLDVAEGEITRWHSAYNKGDARALYGLTGPEFREVTPITQMEELVTTVTDKMGAVEDTEREGFSVNTNNGVTYTVVTMKTEFSKGEGTETFTFQGNGEETRLVGWNVDSENFMAEPEEVDVDVPEEAVTEITRPILPVD